MKSISEIRASDYVTPTFFRTADYPRPGIDGQYALAMAMHLDGSGVRPEEFKGFLKQLEATAGPDYWEGSQMRAARGRVRRAAAYWDVSCPEINELLMMASDDIDGQESARVFFTHLTRIAEQHELLGKVRDMNRYEAA